MPDDSPLPPDANPDVPEPDDVPDPDADLIAYLDGELDGAEARAVEAALALDPAVRAKAEAYQRVDGLLDFLPRPAPAPDFTTRTLTRLQPVSAAGASPASGSAPTATLAGSVSGFRPRRSAWPTVVAWMAAATVAGVGGYAAHAALSPTGPPTDLAISDLRVIERLPLYLGVDDLDFLKALDETGLFAPDAPTADPTPRADDPRPELSPTLREKMIALFRSYPLVRQQQIRQLDQAIYDLPPITRDRLTTVLEGYAVWLDRLLDPDRREVLSAPGPGERLDVVRRVREKSWRDSLPARAREQLVQTTDVQERMRLTDLWKQAERARRDEWQLARRQWDVVRDKDGRRPWPFDDPTRTAAVNEYVRTVLKVDLSGKPEKGSLPASARLTLTEFQDLKERHDAAGKEGHWFLYGALLYRLAERHPGSPEPGKGPPVSDVVHLPRDVREVKPRQWLLVVEKRSRGKWPEFAREVADALKKANQPVPAGLGPARPGDFTPAVNTFLREDLFPKLTPAERASLTHLEGKWPAYPDQLMELAAAHDLPVPGVTLPGPPSQWARYYSLTPALRK